MEEFRHFMSTSNVGETIGSCVFGGVVTMTIVIDMVFLFLEFSSVRIYCYLYIVIYRSLFVCNQFVLSDPGGHEM